MTLSTPRFDKASGTQFNFLGLIASGMCRLALADSGQFFKLWFLDDEHQPKQMLLLSTYDIGHASHMQMIRRLLSRNIIRKSDFKQMQVCFSFEMYQPLTVIFRQLKLLLKFDFSEDAEIIMNWISNIGFSYLHNWRTSEICILKDDTQFKHIQTHAYANLTHSRSLFFHTHTFAIYVIYLF